MCASGGAFSWLICVLDFQDSIVAGVDRRDAFHHQVEVDVAGNCAVENHDGFVAAEVFLLDFKAVPAGEG